MLRHRGRLAPGILAFVLAALAFGLPAEAQILKKIKRVVKDAAENETMSQIDRMVRDKVRCVFDDLQCIAEAEKNGEEFVLTDDEGEVLVDDGKPISDPGRGAEVAGKRRRRRPARASGPTTISCPAKPCCSTRTTAPTGSATSRAG